MRSSLVETVATVQYSPPRPAYRAAGPLRVRWNPGGVLPPPFSNLVSRLRQRRDQARKQGCARHDRRNGNVFMRSVVQSADGSQAVQRGNAQRGGEVAIGGAAGCRGVNIEAKRGGDRPRPRHKVVCAWIALPRWTHLQWRPRVGCPRYGLTRERVLNLAEQRRHVRMGVRAQIHFSLGGIRDDIRASARAQGTNIYRASRRKVV